MAPQSPARLPIFQIMSLAWKAVLDNQSVLMKACLIPLILLSLLNYPLVEAGFDVQFLRFVVGSVATTVLAVSCHRIFLLGPESLPHAWSLYFTKREGRYLAYHVGLELVAGAVILFPIVALFFLGSRVPGLVLILPLLMVCLVGYWWARWFLLLPGTTVDQSWTFRASSAITKPHVRRLMALMVLMVMTLAVISSPILLVRFGIRPRSPLLGWLLMLPLQVLPIYVSAVSAYAFLFVCPEHLRPTRGDWVASASG